MKIRGTIEDILRQKYEEMEIPDDIFNLDEILRDVKPIKKKNNTLKYVASFAIAIVAIFSITICVINISDNKAQVEQQAGSNGTNVEENVLPTYVDSVTIQKKNSIMSGANKYENIYIIQVEDILEYSMFQDDGVSYPITKIKAKVLNRYMGDEAEDINFWIPGGICKYSELKQSGLPYNDESLSCYSDNDFIKVSYENMRIATPIENEVYITMLYTKDNELYVNEDLEFGFKEFDVNTSMFKNNKEEWKPLDLTNYIK